MGMKEFLWSDSGSAPKGGKTKTWLTGNLAKPMELQPKPESHTKLKSGRTQKAC